MDVNRELPNLKISVENTGAVDEAVELEDVDQNEDISNESEASNVKVNVNLSTFDKPIKRYENPQAGIFEGEDLEVIQKKLQGRASRFGLKENETAKKYLEINDNDITELYEGLKMNEKDIQSGVIRLNAIHMRGVQDMSTEEVFSYFNQFCPASMEWINDCSCNVLWLKDEDAAKAMISLSSDVISKERRIDKALKNLEESKEEDATEDNTVMAVEEDDEDGEEKSEVTDYEEKTVTNIEDKMECSTENNGTEPDISDVVVPPGCWRLGVATEKSKAILLRFATKHDKKVRGAEKISNYYKKHGNPNYKGLQGVISNSRKRKLRSGVTNEYKEILTEKKIDNQSKSSSSSESEEELSVNSKIPKQKMYADIEEDRIKQRIKKKATAAKMKVYDPEPETDLRALLNEKKKPSAFSRISYRCSDTDEEEEDREDSEGSFSPDDLRNELLTSKIHKPDLRSRLGPSSKNQHRSPLVSE